MDAIPSEHPAKLQTIVNSEPKTEKNEENVPNKIQVVTKLALENSDLTLTTNLSICKQSTKFLIDTGAHASMIKSKCLLSNVLYLSTN